MNTFSGVLQAQHHASKARTAKEEPALWAVQCAAHGSNSFTYNAAKRVYSHHKQLKLLRQNQGNPKLNSKKRQHANLLR